MMNDQETVNLLVEFLNINKIDQADGLKAMSSVIIDVYRRKFTKEDLEKYFDYLRIAYEE